MSLYDEVKQGSYKNAINKLAKKTQDIVEVLESDDILDALGLEIAREVGYNTLQLGGDITYKGGYSLANIPVYTLGDNDIFAFIEKHILVPSRDGNDILSRYAGSMCYSGYINNDTSVFDSAVNPEGEHTVNAMYFVDDNPDILADVDDIEYSIIVLRKKGE